MKRFIMKRSIAFLLLLALLSFTGCQHKNDAVAASAAGQINYSEQTITAVQKLTDGDIAGFYQMFDESMKKEMTQDEVQILWNKLTYQYGPFQYYLSSISINATESGQTACIPCVFEKGTLTFQMTFNKAGAISGFYMAEGENSAGSPRLGNDIEVSFGTEEYPISGSLTLPEGAGPFPAVILVQDSGAYDRNEQIGPNVPFLNLAEQLSQAGIAVLRYDKRSYLYENQLAQSQSFTVYEETIDDVAAALEFLQTRSTICQDQIYIAGHSMAGYLMPRIAKATPDAAGYILLAASVRPLEDILLEQTQYVLNTDSSLDQASKDKLLDQAQQTADRIKGLDASSECPAAELYSRPVSYWLDLQDYDPLAQIRQVTRPLLIIQGGRDYQVPASELELWKAALEGNQQAQFLYYDNLNHLFMTGTGKSTPAEYQQKGTVSTEVSNAIASFVSNSADTSSAKH